MCAYLHGGYVCLHVYENSLESDIIYVSVAEKISGPLWKKIAVYFLATFPILWEDMIMELDTNWLGQCRTASLCWLGRQQQVTLCNIALNKPHFPSASVSE